MNMKLYYIWISATMSFFTTAACMPFAYNFMTMYGPRFITDGHTVANVIGFVLLAIVAILGACECLEHANEARGKDTKSNANRSNYY